MFIVGICYLALELCSEAETQIMFVIKSQQERTGFRHVDTLVAMRLLGNVYIKQERRDEAETLLIQVVEVRSEVLGTEHAHTVEIVNDLIEFYEDYNMSKVEGFKQVVEIRRQRLGDKSPATMAAMALVHFCQGRCDGTEKSYSKNRNVSILWR